MSDRRVAPDQKTELIESKHDEGDEHRAPGTFVLVIVLLVSFAVYYFANWKALADVWHVR